MSGGITSTETSGEEIDRCGSCDAEIIWAVKTKNHKRMPIDAEPVEGGNVEAVAHDKRGGCPYVVVHSQPPTGVQKLYVRTSLRARTLSSIESERIDLIAAELICRRMVVLLVCSQCCGPCELYADEKAFFGLP